MVITIIDCARCKENHYDLEFKRFTYPVEDKDGTLWRYWTYCPTNNEPILSRRQPEEINDEEQKL